jgi:hypothetical protein
MTTEIATPALTKFLLARIAEDEADARAATPGHWWNESGTVHACLPFGRDDGLPGAACHPLDAQGANGLDADADAEHASRWNPARVIAECDAKRRIVQAAASIRSGPSMGPMSLVLDLMALPYADHPDYRAEWRL